MLPEGEFEPNPDVAYREIEGQLLLLAANDDVLYTLNGTGKLAWEMLTRGTGLGDIAEHMAATYGISVENARRDIGAFFDELERQGIVVRRS